jgi:uncharacterized protein (TIGR03790 family)
MFAHHLAPVLRLAAVTVLALGVAPVRADIAEDEVLVVYNSASADATALLAAYLAAHPGIPVANRLDLNDPTLLVANLSYTDFVNKVRTPIRNYLSAPGFPQPADIIAIALLRPFPHRILDTDNANVGDSPSQAANELNAGDATYAALDSELALLWQNLNTGEAGGTMDSLADNVIDNPYHTSTLNIDAFSRSNITSAKVFSNAGNAAWLIAGAGASRLTSGDIYLVCRIDGTTLAQAQAIINRAATNRVHRRAVRILLDEYDLSMGNDLDDDPLFMFNDPFVAGDDYEETRNLLLAFGWDVRYDDTFNFISSTEETNPLIAYASYGENHDIGAAGEDPPGTGTYINGFNFPPGAIFNTIESFNGRAFNGLGTAAGQEQAADFLAAGGTFAVGNVYEPFTFSLPDNEFLFVNMLVRSRTFAEAAYSSFPVLSWQQIAVGDPLARIHLLGDIDDDGDLDPNDVAAFVDCLGGPTRFTPPPGCSAAEFDRADLNADMTVDLADYRLLQEVFGP